MAQAVWRCSDVGYNRRIITRRSKAACNPWRCVRGTRGVSVESGIISSQPDIRLCQSHTPCKFVSIHSATFIDFMWAPVNAPLHQHSSHMRFCWWLTDGPISQWIRLPVVCEESPKISSCNPCYCCRHRVSGVEIALDVQYDVACILKTDDWV